MAPETGAPDASRTRLVIEPALRLDARSIAGERHVPVVATGCACAQTPPAKTTTAAARTTVLCVVMARSIRAPQTGQSRTRYLLLCRDREVRVPRELLAC